MFRLLMLMLLPVFASAQGFQFEEGTHYVALEIPVKNRNADVVDVTEYFSYGCPHCYRFEPMLAQWAGSLPADVEFNRSPAIWQQPGYELFGQTYYAIKALGELERIHAPLFQAIHSERRNLTDLRSITTFMVEQGIDAETFVKAFNSFGVKAQYQQAIARQRAYRARGVPCLIINGKYRIETTMVESTAELLQVANFLINRERRSLGTSGTD